MKGYFNWCLLLALTGLSFAVSAQNITVTSKLDKSTILLGDQTVLRVTASLPAIKRYAFLQSSDRRRRKVRHLKGSIWKVDNQSGVHHHCLRCRCPNYTCFRIYCSGKFIKNRSSSLAG
jgi:hypothetical protein